MKIRSTWGVVNGRDKINSFGRKGEPDNVCEGVPYILMHYITSTSFTIVCNQRPYYTTKIFPYPGIILNLPKPVDGEKRKLLRKKQIPQELKQKLNGVWPFCLPHVFPFSNQFTRVRKKHRADSRQIIPGPFQMQPGLLLPLSPLQELDPYFSLPLHPEKKASSIQLL